ncbi:MAG: DUF6056 family protein [Lachnospiraceae bacterium]|nr:DUF6056 family protein [Lachnospiraceae bacterium]
MNHFIPGTFSSHKQQESSVSSAGPVCALSAWLFYSLSVVPLLILAFCNYPSADDINMGVGAHDAFQSTGNILAVWGQGIWLAWYDYFHWMGYYTSTALMAVPPSVFGERFYAAGAFILIAALTAAVTFFLHTLLGKLAGMDRAPISIISALTLFLAVQALPDGMARVESFYWYCSGANYILTWCMGLVWISLLIRLTLTEKHRIALTAGSCLLGFLVGGGNMMTSLTCAIVSVLVLIWLALPANGGIKGTSFKRLLLPVLFLLVGFLLCCLAPGNSVREGMVSGFGPVKAIAVSLHYTASCCINTWTRVEHLLVLLFFAPLFWMAAPKTKLSFRYPLLIAVLAYGLASANVTPPLYALGQITAGRLQALFYMQYLLLFVLTEGYLIGWLRCRVLQPDRSVAAEDPDAATAGTGASTHRRTLVAYWGVLTAMFLVLSGLALISEPAYYTAGEAVRELTDGSAAGYRAENEERFRILNDASVTDVVLTPYQNHPPLLFFSDLDTDPENWLNDGMRRYFHKNSVRLAPDAQQNGD